MIQVFRDVTLCLWVVSDVSNECSVLVLEGQAVL